jgi:PIN domain nuclease of toxin-antitoxin system
MNALLDTHAFVWSLQDPKRLSRAAYQVIVDGKNQLFISSASAWELATKYRLGKFPKAYALVSHFKPYADSLNALILPIDYNHALEAGLLPGSHRDPFDRIIAAQAQIEGLELLSQDPAFKTFPVSIIW